jgi:predicted nucleic acid-binding protein
VSLAEIPRGGRVFLDASIFLHHFLGASAECRSLLERCERAEVRGLTSALVVAEVSGRLLRLEAAAQGHAETEGDLRERPELLQKLHLHEEVATQIPLMGIEVLPLDLRVLLKAAALRRRPGLLVGPSLVAAGAREAGIGALATAEAGFERVEGLAVYRPSDLDN